MKKSEIYTSNFLKASTLIDRKQRSMTLTIKGISTHAFDDGKKQRVLSFEEIDEALGLNPTNWDTIASLLGKDDDDDWIGDKITIYVTKTTFKGQTVDCIRVDDRPSTNEAAPAPAPAPAAASGNGAAGNPDAPFGEKWAKALQDKLNEENITVDALINEMAILNRDHADKAKGRPIEEWPRCVMPTAKAAITGATIPF